ncbi:hypothetical protein [Oscillatoria sp. FACHB-1406]|nr:hypothetical protein [Oscillatoria sp. FACHB-1406]
MNFNTFAILTEINYSLSLKWAAARANGRFLAIAELFRPQFVDA